MTQTTYVLLYHQSSMDYLFTNSLIQYIDWVLMRTLVPISIDLLTSSRRQFMPSKPNRFSMFSQA